jgi:hypothetical protein
MFKWIRWKIFHYRINHHQSLKITFGIDGEILCSKINRLKFEFDWLFFIGNIFPLSYQDNIYDWCINLDDITRIESYKPDLILYSK